MQKQELLKLLGPEAREAFESAKQLARLRGGAVSPLHLVVTLLDRIPAPSQKELARLHEHARRLIGELPAPPSQSIVVTRETQAVISAAGRVAKSAGHELASTAHLLGAALATSSLRKALACDGDVDRAVAELLATPASGTAHDEAVESVRGASSEINTAPLPSAPAPSRALEGALLEFCVDLTEASRAISSHPFVGREREITAVLETLCRKLKNNPLLIGKPGVGKTAIVTAVSGRLSEGSVPPRLRGKRILEVSRLRLLADAKFSGDIEERLKTLLEEVHREGDVILFFDEIHTLLGAGGAGGTGDVANLLKSSLSKGESAVIGATTLAEYYKYIARDEALARRFSTITIEEPSLDETRRIVSVSRAAFEAYHGVRIEEDVISLIIEKADRYLCSRSFPDKAFDLMDKAAAKAALAGRDRLSREDVSETLSETTGLPLEIMDEDPADRLERLEDFLNAAVPGQPRAVRDVARVVRIAKLGLELRPEQPDGVFLFAGPEGVGKHEMAAALAKFLYGSPQKMIEFDMSQFTEQHSISRLIGAEPGYVGYGERAGLLSKAAEDNPHSVLYFKNVDLAHPVVQQFLGEAFEQGRFTDATGARISLSNTTVAMSLSRVSENSKPIHIGFSSSGEFEVRRAGTGSLARERTSRWGLAETLAAAIDEVVDFQVLDQAATEKIIRERLDSLVARLESSQPVAIRVDPELARFFTEQLAAERKSLAQLERIWQDTIVIPFTNLRIDRRIVGARPEVWVRVENGAVTVKALEPGSVASR